MTKCYNLFQSTQSVNRYTLLYPVKWQVSESLREGYDELRITSPDTRSGIYVASFTINESKDIPQNVESSLDLFTSRYQSMLNYKFIGKSSGTLLKGSAVEVEIAYSMPEYINRVGARMLTVRDRRLFLKYNHYLYEISFTSPEAVYSTGLDEFRILVTSFRFVEDIQEPTFLPLLDCK